MASMLDFFGNMVSMITGGLGEETRYQNSKDLARFQASLNEAAAEKQNQRNIDFWNMQNEYNDPSAEVRRLIAAGINPAGLNGSLNNSEAESLSAAPVAAPDIASLVNSQVNPVIQGAQVAQMAAQTAQSIAQTDLIKGQTVQQNKQNDFTDQLLQGQVDIQGRQYQLLGIESDEAKARIKKLGKDTEEVQKRIELEGAQYNNIIEQTALLSQQYHVSVQELQNLKQMYTQNEQSFNARLNEIWSRVESNNASAGYSREQTNLAKQMVTNMILQNGITGLQFSVDEYINSLQMSDEGKEMLRNNFKGLVNESAASPHIGTIRAAVKPYIDVWHSVSAPLETIGKAEDLTYKFFNQFSGK